MSEWVYFKFALRAYEAIILVDSIEFEMDVFFFFSLFIHFSFFISVFSSSSLLKWILNDLLMHLVTLDGICLCCRCCCHPNGSFLLIQQISVYISNLERIIFSVGCIVKQRLHNEPVFIRTMIDRHSNQTGSGLSLYICFFNWSFIHGAVCEPTLSVLCCWSMIILSTAHYIRYLLRCVYVCVFSLDIPSPKEFILVFPLFVRWYEKNQHENTQTHHKCSMHT